MKIKPKTCDIQALARFAFDDGAGPANILSYSFLNGGIKLNVTRLAVTESGC